MIHNKNEKQRDLPMIPNECIILGGGVSINTGINLGLKDKIKNKFVITCNYAYRDFKHTFLNFLDKNFYVPDYAKNYVNKSITRHSHIYNELKKESLIIGINDNGIEEFKLDNTVLLNKKHNTCLTGIFAINLAIKIMTNGTIYLLGFDWNRRTNLPERDPNYNPNSDLQIHYYNNIKHRGIGYVGYYENHNPNKLFIKYIKNKNLKIYNVSLDSNINCFEKISYKQMFDLLNSKKCKQKELRLSIRKQLTTIK